MAERGALILNEVLPPELRGQLEATAQSQDVTLNDVAGSILAEYFGMDWEYSGNSYRPMAARFKLRVPEKLHVRLRVTAALDMQTVVRGIVLRLLSRHYKLDVIPQTRRPRSAP